jgi:hypothetical protein
MRREATDYVKGCAKCQRHKVNNQPTKAALEPIWAKPEATPFETIAIDFITKLPLSQGYDSILTVTDHDCSKATIFIPCVEEISGEETAAAYAKHVFARYGPPVSCAFTKGRTVHADMGWRSGANRVSSQGLLLHLDLSCLESRLSSSPWELSHWCW